jgi:hypothetical protein
MSMCMNFNGKGDTPSQADTYLHKMYKPGPLILHCNYKVDAPLLWRRECDAD